ncbi:MAG: hypothetical protein HY011_35235 [Acidobacteria bacterium]|nr:hypothetical protein [Acidobacteriota bacterium]
MRTTHKHLLHVLVLSPLLALSTLAAEPGAPYPNVAVVSDQKAGSLLVYNIYSSSSTEFNAINTRISVTNVNQLAQAYVHLFFVDGANCGVADSYLCLTPSQTVTFLMSDVDPGVTGYLVALAVDERTGCPLSFNYLIGDEFCKLPSGHFGNLLAESFAAQYGGVAECDAASPSATLWFDASSRPGSYNLLPRTLAADNIADRPTGNSTLLVVNRIGGNLSFAAATINKLFGVLYDDAEHGYSFSIDAGACQTRTELTNTTPRLTPRFETIIPAGRSGWLKLSSTDTTGGLLGAVFNYHPETGAVANAFNGGHNLHKLTFNDANAGTVNAPNLIVPVFPPTC